MSPTSMPSSQRGVVLVVGLVVLVMMTLTVLSAVKLSTSNLQAVANMQSRDAALAAANLASEQVLSTNFINAPAAATVDVDLDQDDEHVIDYHVDVPTPDCRWWQPTPTSSLDVNDPHDQSCFTGSSYQAMAGGSSSSFCADTLWEVRAQVEDAFTGTVVTVNQGVRARMNLALAGNACD